jgi:hypothetical protein
MVKITHEEFINRLPISRLYKILSNYDGIDNNVLIEDKYGKCLMKAYDLMKGRSTTIQSAVDKEEYFLNKAKEVHGNKYTYKNFIYRGGREYSVITCLLHGDFKQKPFSHLSGKGCAKCKGMKIGGWKRSDFIRIAGERNCTFYILRCFNENEEFYKIGITSLSIKRRYNTPSKMPYNYETIKEIKGTALEIWDLEKEYKRKSKKNQYIPLISFGGSCSECFKDIKYENLFGWRKS